MTRHTPRVVAALAALLVTTPALADGWYGGVDFGRVALDESGYAGLTTPGFGGPTIDHDVCGGTATISIGSEPVLGALDGSSTGYKVFLGWRRAQWALELSSFNVARIAGAVDDDPLDYPVTAQPTCNPVPTTPITIGAEGRKVETLSFDGLALTPVYSFELAEDWTLDLRATVAFWQGTQRSQWQVLVTEFVGPDPLQTYVAATSNAGATRDGTDLWLGVGASWRIKDGVRLRALLEQQEFDALTALAWSVGVAIDF